MKVLKVSDMHCGKCVERITKTLEEEKLDFSVSLTDKTVTINGCDGCVAKALEKLDDIGFSAEIM